ncbi:MAG: hypothetical protein ACXVUE_20960 [Solirubrobacteraceae bacterium]
MFTSHHITKLIAAERVAQLRAEATPKRREAGERRLVRRARRLARVGRTARQPVASGPSGLAPGSPEG